MIDYNEQVLPLCPWPAVHFSSTILLNLKINVRRVKMLLNGSHSARGYTRTKLTPRSTCRREKGGGGEASPPQWRKVPATKWRRRQSFWKIHRNGVLCCCQIVACFVFYHSCTISLAPSDGEFTPTAGKVDNMVLNRRMKLATKRVVPGWFACADWLIMCVCHWLRSRQQ